MKSDPQEDKHISDLGEGEKLNQDYEGEEALKEKMRSAERLSLMIRFNHRGSLTSLDQGSRLDLYRTNSSRRNSTTMELTRARTRANSSPKIDLLKSTMELSHLHKSSNPQLNKPAAPPPLQRHTTKVNNETVAITSPQSGRKNCKNLPIEEYRTRSDSIPEEEEAISELHNKLRAADESHVPDEQIDKNL